MLIKKRATENIGKYKSYIYICATILNVSEKRSGKAEVYKYEVVSQG